MPEIPAEIKPGLLAWWAGLDPGNQAIFEAIWMNAPEAVSLAISGGQWQETAAEPGLAALLGGGPGEDNFVAANDAIPRAFVEATPEVTPFQPGLGQAVTISWVEKNASTADLPAYVSDIYVTDGAGEQVAGGRLQGAPLAAGASADRTFPFPGVAAAGGYNVLIWSNSEGADPTSGVPGPQGYRMATGTQFRAGAGDQEADEQEHTMWFTATGELMQCVMPDSAAEHLPNAINWLAGVEVELVTDEFNQTTPAVDRAPLEQVSSWLEYNDLKKVTYAEAQESGLDEVLAQIVSTVGRIGGGGPTSANLQSVVDAIAPLAKIRLQFQG